MRGEKRFEDLDEEFFLPTIDVDDRAQFVKQAVASLPPLQREVLILAEYEELSLMAAALLHQRPPAPQAATSVDLAQFQPVKNLNYRVIRREQ